MWSSSESLQSPFLFRACQGDRGFNTLGPRPDFTPLPRKLHATADWHLAAADQQDKDHGTKAVGVGKSYLRDSQLELVSVVVPLFASLNGDAS